MDLKYLSEQTFRRCCTRHDQICPYLNLGPNSTVECLEPLMGEEIAEHAKEIRIPAVRKCVGRIGIIKLPLELLERLESGVVGVSNLINLSGV